MGEGVTADALCGLERSPTVFWAEEHTCRGRSSSNNLGLTADGRNKNVRAWYAVILRPSCDGRWCTRSCKTAERRGGVCARYQAAKWRKATGIRCLIYLVLLIFVNRFRWIPLI